MPDLTTASVVEDYIRYKLSSKGLEWRTYCSPETSAASRTGDPVPTSGPTPFQAALRDLTAVVERRFHRDSNGMAITDSLHVTPSRAAAIFHRVTYEIFHHGENSEQSQATVRASWGRISSLLAFSGALAVHCVQNEMPQLVGQITEWTISYIDTNLLGWINEHGGWNGLIPPPDPSHDPWLTYRTVLGVAALGAVTALAMILVR